VPSPPRRGSRIHRGLVGERALVGRDYLADEELRREYARDIAPRTTAALGKILAEVYSPEVPAPRRALDLGAGTGAATAALRARFGDLEAVGVDRVAAPGLLRADLAVELPPVEGRFELIVAAHLLNELYAARPAADQITLRARRVRAWSEALLAPGGTIIIVEPALRETSRALLAVRDLLITGPGGPLDVVAPCFWRGPCPALAHERDWCHDAAPVPSRPRVDFSYLVLRGHSSTAPAALSPYRVVSDPLPEKGRLKLYACGPTGRHPFIRLDRHRSPSNAAFAGLKRGDTARIENAEPASDGLRILEATLVES
jgi:hypothetical protein